MDFWQVHGIGFLLCITFFPRLTLLLATAIGGPLWWIGLIFAPRLMVAILAITFYWNTNPVLCIIASMIAFSGEAAEKKAVHSETSR